MQPKSAGCDEDELLVRRVIYHYYELREALAEPSAKALALDHIRVEGKMLTLTDALASKLDIEMAAAAVDRTLRSEKTLLILCARLHGRTKRGKPDRNGVVKMYTYGVPWDEVATFAHRPVQDVKEHLRRAIPIMAHQLRLKDAKDADMRRDVYEEAFIPNTDYMRSLDGVSVAEYADMLRRGLSVAPPRFA